MSDTLSTARKFANENPVSADNCGLLDALEEVDRLRGVNAKLRASSRAWREFGEMLDGRRLAGEVPTDWIRDNGKPGPLTIALDNARKLSTP